MNYYETNANWEDNIGILVVNLKPKINLFVIPSENAHVQSIQKLKMLPKITSNTTLSYMEYDKVNMIIILGFLQNMIKCNMINILKC